MPVPQLMYIGMNGTAPAFESYILVLDPATDAVIDSIPNPSASQLQWLLTSPDGQFMAIGQVAPISIWFLETLEFLTTLPTGAISLLFLPDEGTMLATVYDSTFVYSVPGFNVVGSIPHELLFAERIPGTSNLIGQRIGNTTGGPPFDQELTVFDYSAGVIVDTFVPRRDTNSGADAFLHRVQVAPDGKHIYGIMADRDGFWIYGYDLDRRAMTFSVPYEHSSIGRLRITPDGRELWLTHGANMFFLPWPEYVTVLDATTGIPLDTIFMSREELEWPRRISPTDILFYPDGRKGYVICGTGFTQEQPVIVVDMDTKEILSVLFGDTARIPSAVAIGPAQ